MQMKQEELKLKTGELMLKQQALQQDAAEARHARRERDLRRERERPSSACVSGTCAVAGHKFPACVR